MFKIYNQLKKDLEFSRKNKMVDAVSVINYIMAMADTHNPKNTPPDDDYMSLILKIAQEVSEEIKKQLKEKGVQSKENFIRHILGGYLYGTWKKAKTDKKTQLCKEFNE